jgi:type II secretory pathway pseudopilin PulG
MQTGEQRRCGHGFTYLGLLFVLALGGVGLAAIGQAWQQATLREQERESMFRGQQIADAIGAWQAAALRGAMVESAAADGPAKPEANAAPVLADLTKLLEDLRDGQLRRPLRRLYTDPLTGQADWVLLRDARGVISAVHSRSDRRALLTQGLAASSGSHPPRVSDRHFHPRAQAPAPMPALPRPTVKTESETT